MRATERAGDWKWHCFGYKIAILSSKSTSLYKIELPISDRIVSNIDRNSDELSSKSNTAKYVRETNFVSCVHIGLSKGITNTSNSISLRSSGAWIKNNVTAYWKRSSRSYFYSWRFSWLRIILLYARARRLRLFTFIYFLKEY